MPSSYMMSNSHSVNGGATLFFTTLILVRLPMTLPSGVLIWSLRRMSMRIEEKNFSARPPRGRLRAAEHHADLFADLVGEDADALRLAHDRGEAAHGLRHQAGLAAHRHVAHLAVELGLGDQGGDRIEDDDVDAVGADERLHDVERVLAAVGLGDEQVVELHADDAGVFRVERMLDVDEGGEAALSLALGDDAQAEGGLARGFRAVDLDDAAEGQAADAEREVDGERAGRERLDLHLGVAAEAHDRALAELLGDGGERELDVLFPGVRGGGGCAVFSSGALAGAALDMA